MVSTAQSCLPVASKQISLVLKIVLRISSAKPELHFAQSQWPISLLVTWNYGMHNYWALLPIFSLVLGPVDGYQCIILDLGDFGFDFILSWVSCRNRYIVRSWRDDEKERNEKTCHKTHLQLNGKRSLSRTRKENTWMKPPLKTKYHWRPRIIKLCGGE